MDGIIERPSDRPSVAMTTGARHLELTGELDLAAFERTRDLLVETGRGDGVVVDLSAVTFIDSSGLRALIEASNEVELTLTGVPAPVEKILEITGLSEYFDRS